MENALICSVARCLELPVGIRSLVIVSQVILLVIE